MDKGFKQRVQAYLESDRQWTRDLRIKHTALQYKNAHDEAGREFWGAVFDALKD